jgi:FkbM family methyltransferase
MRLLAKRILRRINLGDIAIRHHYTQDKIVLHSFKHRKYWYHDDNREKETMMVLAELIREGDLVIDVGGHIGYVTLYFAKLVGPGGKVVVFEPGPNNLPYIRKNVSVASNIIVAEKAVTDFAGKVTLYVENLTGLNNSLLVDYEPLDNNARNAGITSIDRNAVEV